MTGTPRPWPDEAQPTADELGAWLLVATPDERRDTLGRLLVSAERDRTCFERNHEGHLRHLADELARERTRVDELYEASRALLVAANSYREGRDAARRWAVSLEQELAELAERG